MKKFFYIIGGIACVILIVAAMYVTLVIGITVYMTYAHQASMKARYDQVTQEEERQTRERIAALGNNMTPGFVDKKRDADELAGNSPSLFVDSENYQTEDNWLATKISREIAEMAFVTVHPDLPLPDLNIQAEVNPEKPLVDIALKGFDRGLITSALTPVFAWDPEGYAPLARQLLGTTSGLPAVPESEPTDVLSHLLNLTGPNIATEDVRLSANLQRHPASWQDHESAALILTALALREHAGAYSERRTMLSQATAHLAVAQALRGDQKPTWPGLIADAGIRTLAGREVDALSHLDALTARTDVPDSAKPWIAALRTLAKQDWREAHVTATSPLLLKIVWFQILELDLMTDVAAKHITEVVRQTPQDPSLPADQQKANPETLIPDWGRIAGRSPFYVESSDDAKNGEYQLDLEFHELDEILKTEASAPFDLDKLASIYSEEETDTVSREANGKTLVRVIGTAGFKAASRRHVFAAMISKDPESSQDPAQMEILFTKFDQLLHGVPGWDMARLHLNFLDAGECQKQVSDWVAAKRTWRIWEVPYGLADTMPGFAMVKKFYHRAVPFGTVIDLEDRYTFINAVDSRVAPPPYDTPELEKIKALPTSDAIRAINEYTKRYNVLLQATEVKGPKPFELELLKLDPDQYVLATDHVPIDKLMAAAGRFLDYNLHPIEQIENLDSAHLSDADREIILSKHAALEPQFSPILAELLRKNGKDDEAAEMDRKDLDDLSDYALSVLMPLIDYDLDHGLYDEVRLLASKADLSTEKGQTINFWLLERSGKLDEAEACGKVILATFKRQWPLAELYASHQDHFPSQFAEEERSLFPKGLVKVSLASFSGKPLTGAVLCDGPDFVMTLNGPKWRMDRVGLQANDVVVALDGYRVESGTQYTFVKNLSQDPKMDFIIWRDSSYREINATVPYRRLDMLAWSYLPPE